MAKDGAKGEGKAFFNQDEAISAYNAGAVSLHARIKVRREGELVSTTAGRVIFNESVPSEIGFINELLEKKMIGRLVSSSFKLIGFASG